MKLLVLRTGEKQAILIIPRTTDLSVISLEFVWPAHANIQPVPLSSSPVLLMTYC